MNAKDKAELQKIIDKEIKICLKEIEKVLRPKKSVRFTNTKGVV